MVHQKTLRFRKRSVGSVGLGLVVVLLSLYAVLCLGPFFCARSMLGRFEELRVGRATFENAETIARRLGAEAERPCDRTSCNWALRIDNARLPAWWRGKGETVALSFSIKDAVVDRKSIGYGTGLKTDTLSPSSVTLVEAKDWGRVPRPVPVAAGWVTTELYPYYDFMIYMTPNAVREDKRRYTLFNFDCLWRYKGCRDARELLPAAGSYR